MVINAVFLLVELSIEVLDCFMDIYGLLIACISVCDTACLGLFFVKILVRAIGLGVGLQDVEICTAKHFNSSSFLFSCSCNPFLDFSPLCIPVGLVMVDLFIVGLVFEKVVAPINFFDGIDIFKFSKMSSEIF